MDATSPPLFIVNSNDKSDNICNYPSDYVYGIFLYYQKAHWLFQTDTPGISDQGFWKKIRDNVESGFRPDKNLSQTSHRIFPRSCFLGFLRGNLRQYRNGCRRADRYRKDPEISWTRI